MKRQLRCSFAIRRACHVELSEQTIITDTEALSAFCARLSRAPFVTVDTEFMRESTFWAQLCLIQVAGPDEAAIVDPLAAGIDLGALLSR